MKKTYKTINDPSYNIKTVKINITKDGTYLVKKDKGVKVIVQDYTQNNNKPFIASPSYNKI